MNERTGIVTMRGNPVVLMGNEIKVGDKAPDCTLVANDLSPKSLAAYKGKVCIVYAVPSLDTPVCDVSTRRFNQEAAALGPDVAIVVVSMDLPFAQKRWCGAAGVEAVETLSDYRDATFGAAYGVLLKDLRLLSRAVFVADRSGTIQYTQIVSEIADEPDFDAVLAAAKKLV